MSYISRQAAIDFIDAGHLCNPNEPRWSDNEVVNFLKSRPSADVRENVRGEWIGVYEDEYPQDGFRKCSVCGWIKLIDEVYPDDFCPNCGADMRKPE